MAGGGARAILITRPEADAAPLVAALAGHRIGAVVAPLIEIVDLDGPPLDLAGVQALLATSANGVRALARRTPERAIRLFAVGDATARTAEACGFARVESAAGDVDRLADLVGRRADPRAGSLLHAAGSKVAGDLAGRLAAAGFGYRREVLYEAQPAVRMPAAARRALEAEAVDGVALYSPRTATAFADLARADGLAGPCRRLVAYCLSAAVAERAGALSWRRLAVAERPDQEALIAAVVAGSNG